MSFSALATVSAEGSTTDSVKQVLTDIFSCLIEINRKTKREVRMTIGSKTAFGCLFLFKNGEIIFEK